jgi:hypothetical protein
LTAVETTLQRISRLVGALEDLASQESATLRAGRLLEAIEIQKRSESLVESVAFTRVEISGPLRGRIEALVQRRRETDAWIATEIEAIRRKLNEAAETQRRVARIVPAYGRPGVARKRLRAIG